MANWTQISSRNCLHSLFSWREVRHGSQILWMMLYELAETGSLGKHEFAELTKWQGYVTHRAQWPSRHHLESKKKILPALWKTEPMIFPLGKKWDHMARNWGLTETQEAENKIWELSDKVSHLLHIWICQLVTIDFTLRALRVPNLYLALSICY